LAAEGTTTGKNRDERTVTSDLSQTVEEPWAFQAERCRKRIQTGICRGKGILVAPLRAERKKYFLKKCVSRASHKTGQNAGDETNKG